MSTTIQYNSNYADYSISDYLREWAESFGDIDQATTKDRGSFSGSSTLFSGTQYAIGSSHGNPEGMIAEGNLKYSFMPQHTFYGQIDTLQFGKDLATNAGGPSAGKHLEKIDITFNELDLSGEFDSGKSMTENHQGDMHKAILGLRKGNADPMLEVMKAKGFDVDTAFKDLSIASQYPDSGYMSDAPMVDTVGVVDCYDMQLAA
ncbi:heme acquisition protein HasA [Yersinia pseudotuberculosis]|uniref:heme acquisition protein HasA n=1 Tax=Yersinia pseudotuberculosis TaxID=633 RepID=UPI0038B682ED